MKRACVLLYVCLPMLVMGGCSASLEADRHDVERLLLVQTMGLDSGDGRLQMSVSSGLGAEDKPALVMSTAADSIEAAISQLQILSPENQLFYAHVQYLLLGEEAAREKLNDVIQWVDRSPTLRMDTDLMVIRGQARQAVTGASSQATDITQRLESLRRQARSTGWTVYTLREAAAALAEGDGALCLAVEAVPTEGSIHTEEMRSDAIIPAGYAILNGSGLAAFLTPEESLGAELLTGDPTGLLVTVEGSTMEVLEGGAEITGSYGPEGEPAGIHVRCSLRTGVLEKAPGAEADPEALDRALSEEAARWVTGALEKARASQCDYLGLKRALLTTARARETWGRDWPDRFPALPVTVSVDGQVDRSYDLNE